MEVLWTALVTDLLMDIGVHRNSSLFKEDLNKKQFSLKVSDII